jgi:adenylate kinase family enzyme
MPPAALPLPGSRVVVGGISGAGKTRLAREVARRRGLPYFEMDALMHGPGWEPRPTFAADVHSETAAAAWVTDSDGYDVCDLVWGRADTLVWLDYRRPVVMSRVVRRSVARVTYDRELWNGNRERLRDWLRWDHPIRWAWAQHPARRATIAARVRDPRFAHLVVVHLMSPRAARRWLGAL